MDSGSPARVAIVGTGLAGLVTAYLLQKSVPDASLLQVDLYERNAHIGMDSESVTVLRDGQPYRIDVSMRAFSKGMYKLNER